MDSRASSLLDSSDVLLRAGRALPTGLEHTDAVAVHVGLEGRLGAARARLRSLVERIVTAGSSSVGPRGHATPADVDAATVLLKRWSGSDTIQHVDPSEDSDDAYDALETMSDALVERAQHLTAGMELATSNSMVASSSSLPGGSATVVGGVGRRAVFVGGAGEMGEGVQIGGARRRATENASANDEEDAMMMARADSAIESWRDAVASGRIAPGPAAGCSGLGANGGSPTSAASDEDDCSGELILVETEAALEAMAADLVPQRGCCAVAVQMVQHSLRSFRGFTCLVVLATRRRRYAVDAVALRSVIAGGQSRSYRKPTGQRQGGIEVQPSRPRTLRDVFEDPRVAKVMHDAARQVPWLQRDFGIRVVNIWDTGVLGSMVAVPDRGAASTSKKSSITDPSRVMAAPAPTETPRTAKESAAELEALLVEHIGVRLPSVILNKPDWRRRPFPAVALAAVSGRALHLLHLYDALLERLAEVDDPEAVGNAVTKCAALALRRYDSPVWVPRSDEHLTLYERQRQGVDFSATQLRAFARLYEWRHTVARDEDDSCRYVLPNYMLFNLAYKLPDSPNAVIAVCDPTPVHVRINAHDIAHAINLARMEAADAPESTPGHGGLDGPSASQTTHTDIVAPASSPAVDVVRGSAGRAVVVPGRTGSGMVESNSEDGEGEGSKGWQWRGPMSLMARIRQRLRSSLRGSTTLGVRKRREDKGTDDLDRAMLVASTDDTGRGFRNDNEAEATEQCPPPRKRRRRRQSRSSRGKDRGDDVRTMYT